MRILKNALVLLIAITLFSPIIVVNSLDYSSKSLTLEVFPDGSVIIEHKIKPDPTMPRVNVTLLGEQYTDLLAVDEDGLILDWDPVDGRIEVDSIGAEELTISYSTLTLTNKTGSKWAVSVESTTQCSIVLPQDSMLVGLSSTPISMSVKENRANITMPSGNISISYSLGVNDSKEHSLLLLLRSHELIQEAKDLEINTDFQEEMLEQATDAYESSSYSQSEGISQQIIDEISDVIESATQAFEQITYVEDLMAQKVDSRDSEVYRQALEKLDGATSEYEVGNYNSAYSLATEAIQLLEQPDSKNPLLYVLGVCAVLGVLGSIVYFWKRKDLLSGEKAPEVDLDRVFKYKDNLRMGEKAVLRFLQEQGGAFMTEVRDQFDMPKSTAWRMMKRLENEDLIKTSTVGRETYLQLKDWEGLW